MVLRLAVLGATAVLLLRLSTAGRRPAPSIPDLPGYLVRWSLLHGGYDPRRSVFVRSWLSLIYRLAGPLARVGVRPDVLTLWGLAVGGSAAVLADLGRGWPLLAALAVVGTGLLDGLDGAVAVLGDRDSRLGFVLDSLADRVVDGFYLLALWRVGAPAGLCVAAGAGVGLLEYTRARAAAAGMAEIGVVTVGERPTRVVVIVVTLACCAAYADRSSLLAGLGAGATLVVSLLGLAQLLLVVRQQLR